MKEDTTRRAPAADRAVLILDELAGSPRPLGVSDLARALQAPKSSVYGICETLAAAGVLRADATGYSLTAHCLKWSAAYLQRSSIISEFQHLLDMDRRLEDFTVTLSMLERQQVVYLACRNSTKPLGFTFQIGMQLPAVYSATGKAMLAHLPENEVSAILDLPWHPAFTAKSVRNASDFLSTCRKWRHFGYAVEDGEIRDGMVCFGAPILDDAGRPVFGVAISMTSEEAPAELRDRLGALTRELADALQAATGFSRLSDYDR